jgi:hypothetical protein
MADHSEQSKNLQVAKKPRYLLAIRPVSMYLQGKIESLCEQMSQEIGTKLIEPWLQHFHVLCSQHIPSVGRGERDQGVQVQQYSTHIRQKVWPQLVQVTAAFPQDILHVRDPCYGMFLVQCDSHVAQLRGTGLQACHKVPDNRAPHFPVSQLSDTS